MVFFVKLDGYKSSAELKNGYLEFDFDRYNFQ